MDKGLKYTMDKRVRSNGYTLIEMILVLFVISVFSLLFFPMMNFDLSSQNFYLFKSDLVRFQSECMAFQKEGVLDTGVYSISYDHEIRFNKLGHVNQAQTIRFIQKEGVIELGNGVFIEK